MRRPLPPRRVLLKVAGLPHPRFAVLELARLGYMSKPSPTLGTIYPTLRRKFAAVGIMYPWPTRLPRGRNCVERLVQGQNYKAKPMMPSARKLIKANKSITHKGHAKVIYGHREAYRDWLEAMREACLPPCPGTCSILERAEG